MVWLTLYSIVIPLSFTRDTTHCASQWLYFNMGEFIDLLKNVKRCKKKDFFTIKLPENGK